jgi:hypothetical protein
MEEWKVIRRVGGRHDYRLDGLTDLLLRAQGMALLDIGCNRGMVGKDFADRGARLIHGCDLNNDGELFVARSVFADIRNVESKFEIVDLTGGPRAIEGAFGQQQYDAILMLATYHKLKRIMPADKLSDLVKHLAGRTIRFFAWRGTSEKHHENEVEMASLDRDLERCDMKRIHTSYMSQELGVAAIWGKRV